ncbi:hypothetical protein Bpfe_003485 [Biomphalaria pfeifferi]|uniref:Uncharacterized protein n=1 Tax=Biomphalaria pfeifferi TaxID=112525 RepID=A0AAD8C7B9_BIOPF|nr:hypothetical protein Bpfe_003485 [Biomphalaria pfeifferi]
MYGCIGVLIFMCQLVILTGLNCDPFEENQPYSIFFTWKLDGHGESKVALDKNGVILATCDTDSTCVNYFDHCSATSITLLAGGSFLINHTIFTATRRDAGQWTLKYLEGIQSENSVVGRCHLASYTKIYSTKCKSQLNKDNVVIMCETANAFPRSRCQFKVSHQQKEWLYSKNISYSYELNQNGRYDYYKTMCSTRVRFLKIGSYTVDVNMFPSVTGDDDRDVLLGFRSFVDVDVNEGSSALVEKCDDMFWLNTSRICVLKVTDNSPEKEYTFRPTITIMKSSQETKVSTEIMWNISGMQIILILIFSSTIIISIILYATFKCRPLCQTASTNSRTERDEEKLVKNKDDISSHL